MVQLLEGGAYLLNGTEIIPDTRDAQSVLESQLGSVPSKEEARKQTIAYGILESHNTSGNMNKLEIKFDKLTSHDITFVGIIQTGTDADYLGRRASGDPVGDRVSTAGGPEAFGDHDSVLPVPSAG